MQALQRENHATSPQKSYATSPQNIAGIVKRSPENITSVVKFVNCHFKSTEKVKKKFKKKTVVTAVTVVTVVRKIMQPLHK